MLRIIAAISLIVSGIASSAYALRAGELDIGGQGEVKSCSSEMQKYLIFRIGQDEFDNNRNTFTWDFFDRCEDYLEKRDVAAVDSSPETDEIKIVNSRVDEALVMRGYLVRGGRSVVAFASEMIDKDWIGSFITSMSNVKGNVVENECETTLYDVFRKKGFTENSRKLSKAQLMKARALRTVIMRYKDLSSMPNDTAMRAAAVVDEKASAAIGCYVGVDISEKGDAFESCAKGRCKAIDKVSHRRIATSAVSRCEVNGDRTTSYIAAIRAVCGEMGRGMGSELVKSYSSDSREGVR